MVGASPMSSDFLRGFVMDTFISTSHTLMFCRYALFSWKLSPFSIVTTIDDEGPTIFLKNVHYYFCLYTFDFKHLHFKAASSNGIFISSRINSSMSYIIKNGAAPKITSYRSNIASKQLDNLRNFLLSCLGFFKHFYWPFLQLSLSRIGK